MRHPMCRVPRGAGLHRPPLPAVQRNAALRVTLAPATIPREVRPPMLELAIDSASDDAAVALVDGERVLAERRWRVATTYSRELLAGIEATLAAAGAARDAMGAIAVNAGPGGYSSLRTGVATAQGLALALDIPLAGVDRLETHAYPHLAEAYAVGIGAVVAVHQLGRAGLAWAAYAAAPH
ncbi:MAG: tRNA (adenosine(37)-N6)-threonylcarbamoyltransferase complex dimerization subunit type 1 TsaB, partial [Chloroflexi bacterium]|nr:tRNA (adenosine(37)-N6)-threonylcarbamoyltransferase complex dimerization subunit type 1 TsaB [Chloroflexota bacterium]